MASKAIGFLNFKFGADLKGFDRAMKKAQKNLKKFGKNVERTGKNLTTGLTLPILALGAASVKAFDQQAKAETKLLTALKGREDIQQRLIEQAKELQKTTLFGDEATIESQALLASLGLTEEQILMLMPQIQNMASALGTDLKSATSLVSKSVSTTTDALARYFDTGLKGVTGQQERAIVLTKSLTEKFDGQAEAAAKVGAGPLVQMKNQLGDLTEELGEKLMPYVSQFVDWMKKMIKKFNGLTSAQKDSIVKWGLLIAAIGPILIIIGKISIGISSLIPLFARLAATNPYLLAIVGAIAFVKILEKVINRLNDQFTIQKQINKVNTQARQNIADDLTKIKVSTSLLEDENTTLEHKKKLLDDLKKTYPGYYDELDEATLSTQTLKQANENLINSLLKASQVEALKGRLTEIQKEILDAQQDIGTSFLEDWGLTEGFTPLDLMLKTLSTTSGVEGIGNLNKEAEALTNMLTKLMVETEDANEEFKKLDHTTTNLSTNTKNTKGETEKYSRSLDPLIANIKKYSEAYKVLGADMQDVDFFTLKLTESQKLAKAGFMMFGDVLTSSLDSALSSQEKFFDVFVKNIKRAIQSLLVQLAVMTLISAIMPASLGGIGKAAFSSKNILGSLGKIMGFADGGLVTGPTVGLIGEGIGTTASNPEVIAPLDKLKQFIGGGSQNVIVEGVIKGNDIFLSNRNTGTNRQRSV